MKSKFLSGLLLCSILFVSCSKDDDNNNMPETGGEAEASLVTFNDVEFSLDDSARFFSTSTGMMHSAEEATTSKEIGPTIDIVGASNTGLIAFDSPSDPRTDVVEGTKTKFQYQDVSITAADFEAIMDDSKLKDLTIADQNESLPISSKEVILFENAAGKKGAIKIKAINSNRLLVDIKMMK